MKRPYFPIWVSKSLSIRFVDIYIGRNREKKKRGRKREGSKVFNPL